MEINKEAGIILDVKGFAEQRTTSLKLLFEKEKIQCLFLRDFFILTFDEIDRLLNVNNPWATGNAMGLTGTADHFLKYQKEFNWQQLLQWAGSDYGLWYFSHLWPHLDDNEQYWKLLRQAYQHNGHFLKFPFEELKELFSEELYWDASLFLMSPYERSYLKKLPENFTIYRAMSLDEFYSGTYGISWTLKKKVAEKFVGIHKDKCKVESIVYSIAVNKNDVLAYFSKRGEAEIIYTG